MHLRLTVNFLLQALEPSLACNLNLQAQHVATQGTEASG